MTDRVAASLGQPPRGAERRDGLRRVRCAGHAVAAAVARRSGSGVDCAARVPDDREPTDADLDELCELEAAMWRPRTRGAALTSNDWFSPRPRSAGSPSG